jgi:photosystem II stability/assembly factor-like uncharacterized protein
MRSPRNIARYTSGLTLTAAVGLLCVAALMLASTVLASPPEFAPGWSNAGGLNTTRRSHTATHLSDGQAVAAGGWTSVGTNPAGVAAPVVSDPRGTGIIFIGSAGGGVRKSTDNGQTWFNVNNGLTALGVAALLMDPTGPQTVYAGTSSDGVFKTTDGGATWQKLAGTAGMVINCLAADPNRPGVVYAGLTGGPIRKTSDGGATWPVVFAGTLPPGTNPISNVTVDPRNSDIVYAASVGTGAFKSVNAGQSWSAIPALTPRAIFALALDPADSRVLYAGTNEDGVWRTADAGATWQRQGSPGSHVILSLAVDPSLKHTLYAGTAGGGVWQSFDGGSSWQPTGLSGGMALSLALDATRVLYAGTDFAGARVSYDLGATWTDLDPGLGGANGFGFSLAVDPANNDRVFVGTNWSGVLTSQDAGATWAVAGRGFASLAVRQIVFDPSNSQRIYAGSFYGGGLFKSEDGGLTWSRRRFGSAAVYLWTLAVSASSPNVVYAGTFSDGLFKSTDFGDTWAAHGTGLSRQVQSLTLDPSDSNRLFAATQQGVSRSVDGGATWSQVLNKPGWNITINPNVPSTVYATTRTEGVFRSLDGGSTWQDLSTGLTTPASRIMGRSAPVIIDPTNPQTLYVGGEGGVFKSRDGGGHWFAVNSGLGNLSVGGLAMRPRDPAVLYACGPGGVYKTLTGGAPTASPIDDVHFFLRQHYLDFLGREPDSQGLTFWMNEITSCATDQQCLVRRINVSAAFFLSIEFQETGYLAYRAHKAAYGDLPGKPVPLRRADFLPDAQRIGQGVVVGAGDWRTQLENNKRDYFDQFAATERFLSLYPQSLTPEQFIDALNQNAGGALSQAERDALVAELNANAKTRAQALRAVAEDATLAQAEFNKAFVLMQYFGYLRRDPDSGQDADFSGYNFWLQKLNDNQGDFHRAEMVRAFIESTEYRKRFGQ